MALNEPFNPMEMNNIQNNPEYQSALRLVNSNYDRLEQTLTDEQKQLLMRRGFKDSNLFGFGVSVKYSASSPPVSKMV